MKYITQLPFVLIYCLVLTIIIEGVLAIIIGLRKKDLVNVVLVNVLTNPLLNAISFYILYRYNYHYKMYSVYIMEILVVFIEGFIYKKTLDYKKINPYLISLILNGLSYGLGLLLF